MHYGNFGPRETIKTSSEVDNIWYSKKTEYNRILCMYVVVYMYPTNAIIAKKIIHIR